MAGDVLRSPGYVQRDPDAPMPARPQLVLPPQPVLDRLDGVLGLMVEHTLRPISAPSTASAAPTRLERRLVGVRLPQRPDRLVIDAKLGGNLAIALPRLAHQPPFDEQPHLFARQMPAVQVEVFGQLLLVGVAEADANLDRHFADTKAGGDAQPVGTVDDVARLVDDDRHDDGLPFGDVGAQRFEFSIAERRQ
jgi:hypothetical protein